LFKTSPRPLTVQAEATIILLSISLSTKIQPDSLALNSRTRSPLIEMPTLIAYLPNIFWWWSSITSLIQMLGVNILTALIT